MTHPAFALSITDAEQRALIEKFVRDGIPLGRLPKRLRVLLLQFLLRGSVQAEGIRQSQGTFMSGLHTYLLKLGPEMLGAFAKPIDRKIAEALPALHVRLRLQDIVQLMTEILTPALLSERSRPLHFVNIAGGPAIDSLNTLILLRKNQPNIFADRDVTIEVLDLDDAGPDFGKAALAALMEPDGLLHGAKVELRYVRYDWAQTATLKKVLNEAQAKGALVICSSEGGLFEYGADEEIEDNLKVLRVFPDVLAVVGSVTRADKPFQLLQKSSTAALRPRGVKTFRALAEKAGWNVSRAIERPFSDQVILSRN